MKKVCIILLISINFFTGFIKIEKQKSLITVAAASDLKFAMDSIISVFTKDHPDISINVVYGSSGKFFEQISNYAPFDLFFSADIDYPKQLKEKGIAISDVQQYGIGRIVLWSKKIDPNKNKINSLLDNSIIKIAVANPVHAPYGKRAEESMKYYKLYDAVKNKLVFGENISQTAQYVTSGAADIGIVALSLALSPNMQKENGKYWLIPQESHEQLKQGFVILSHAKENAGATSFADFISSVKAKSILKYYGFTDK